MRRKRVKKDMIVYAIVSREENAVYVGKTGAGNHYEAYKNSVRGRKMETKQFFEAADEKKKFPPMYFLTAVTATEQGTYTYMVAWVRYFMERGMTLLNYPGTRDYAMDLLPKTERVYGEIKNLPMETVLAEDKLLVRSYKRRDWE